MLGASEAQVTADTNRMPLPPKPSQAIHYPSYGELVKGLLAGVEAVGFFQSDGKCLWSSDESAEGRLGVCVHETLRTDRPCRHLEDTNCVSFGVPLIANEDLVGVLALSISTKVSKTWDMTVGRIATALKPVVAVLTSEMTARPPMSKSKVLTERTEELEWLFAITATLNSGSGDNAAVEALLAASVDRMGASFGGLAVTEKRLNITYRSPTHDDPSAGVAYQQALPHLMSFVQRQNKPLVLNKPTPGRSALPKQKILAIPVTAPNGAVAGLIAFIKAISGTDFGRRDQYLGRHIARQVGALLNNQYDLATGLLTRVAFEQRVTHYLEGRAAGEHSLVYIDIDRMHAVNEHFGYDAGDEVIVRVADLLNTPLLPADGIAARASGDRFLIFLPGHDASRAQDFAIALQKEISEIAIGTAANRVVLSLSCGVSRLMTTEQPVARGIAAAELACKTAKERGSNRCEVYLDVDESMMRRRSDITGLGQLRDALKNDRLRMYAQKIAPTGNPSECSGLECLVRMIGEDGAVVSPAAFMPVAKRYQMLTQVDEWVIQHSLASLAPYASLMLHSGLYASINLSGQSLSDAGLLGRIDGWVMKSKVPPGRIAFEIAETAAVSNLPLVEKLMRRLRRMGCRFALDDFGAGVISLSYLQSLPVQLVKIDRGLVRDVHTNPRSAEMVAAIVQATRSLDIDCVAKYVESEAAFRKLAALGVGSVQGYFIHRPGPLTDVLHEIVGAASQSLRRVPSSGVLRLDDSGSQGG